MTKPLWRSRVESSWDTLCDSHFKKLHHCCSTISLQPSCKNKMPKITGKSCVENFERWTSLKKIYQLTSVNHQTDFSEDDFARQTLEFFFFVTIICRSSSGLEDFLAWVFFGARSKYRSCFWNAGIIEVNVWTLVELLKTSKITVSLFNDVWLMRQSMH